MNKYLSILTIFTFFVTIPFFASYSKNVLKNKANVEKKVSQKSKENKKSFGYSYPNHTSITIIGGKLLKITDTKTQKKVILQSILDEFKKDIGYTKNNMMMLEFFLPKNKVYKIEFKKYKQYPAFNAYVKVPDDKGRVNIINYENIATNTNDVTLAHFFVGNGNSKKNIKRVGESDIAPDYDESFDIKITSATNLKAIVFSDKIELSWSLPDNFNLQEVILVRKNDTRSISISDGNEIYRGLRETFLDRSKLKKGKYSYAIYAVAKNGDVADANFVTVDTHKGKFKTK